MNNETLTGIGQFHMDNVLKRHGVIFDPKQINIAEIADELGVDVSEASDIVIERIMNWQVDLENMLGKAHTPHPIEHLRKPIRDIELTVRSRRALQKLNIATLADLIKLTDLDLLNVKNFGEYSLNEIKIMLDTYGLKLK